MLRRPDTTSREAKEGETVRLAPPSHLHRFPTAVVCRARTERCARCRSTEVVGLRGKPPVVRRGLKLGRFSRWFAVAVCVNQQPHEPALLRATLGGASGWAGGRAYVARI
jgi:hypothetical protein